MQDHQLIHSSKSNEWFTPTRYVEAARTVLGGIDLDPASCEEANRIVRATRIYTVETDGLAHPWTGRVWLNPPYGKTAGRSNAGIWSQYLIREYLAGRVSQAVLLVNANTGDKWFQPLWAYPICFTDHRIHFISPTGEKDQPTTGSAFVYLGAQTGRFQQVFEQFGPVMPGIKRRARATQPQLLGDAA